MTKEIVIAAYNKDIDWINDISPDVKKTIYQKGDIVRPNEIPLPNFGRCVHTFFNHLLINYNQLSEITFFGQEYPFDHWENIVEIVNGTMENCIDKSTIRIGGYFGFHFNTVGSMWEMKPSSQFESGKIITCDSNGGPHTSMTLNVDSYWDKLFDSKPPTNYDFLPGGHFGMTKQHVHLRPITFYNQIVDLLSSDDIVPYVIERLECYIFSPNFKIKQ